MTVVEIIQITAKAVLMNMGLGRVQLKQANHSWSTQTRQYEPGFPSRSLIESSVIVVQTPPVQQDAAYREFQIDIKSDSR